MNTIELAISKLEAAKVLIEGFPATMVDEANDMKKAELRLGFGSEGLLPVYSKPYYALKSTLSTYMASGGRADLFKSGTWASKIQTYEEDGVLQNRLSNPPSYYKEVEAYSGGEPKGFSDKAEENICKLSGLRLTNELSKLL